MQNTSNTQPQQAAATDGAPSVDLAVKADKKKARTPGLWLLDAFIYPVMNNFAVFAISVYATYMTKHGDKHGVSWFKTRGEALIGFFKDKFKMNDESAEMSKMVFFSFLDGSLMAPFIKLFEDRREKIAKRIDKMLGTVPEDESVYEAEPKQSWKSVLLGRAATAAIVVPTAVALDKIKITDKKDGQRKSLNKMFFYDKGQKWGEEFIETEKGQKWQQKYPKVDFPYLFKTGVFEAFYTTVCTVGLYFSSRFIASSDDKRKAKKTEQREARIHHEAPAYIKPERVTQPTAQESKQTEKSDKRSEQDEAEEKETSRKHEHKPHAAKIREQEVAVAQGMHA